MYTRRLVLLPTRIPSTLQKVSFRRLLHSEQLVLGIETSCDDTAAAIVDGKGNILGESINSQTRIHVECGGIMPPIARDLHNQNIDQVVNDTLRQSGHTLKDLDAIATTVKPGLVMSLDVGIKFTRNLLLKCNKPFIPIHHMEAHALTSRMMHKIEFPFLVLLASGGHCLLAVAKDVDEFLLLGRSVDDAPGDAFDKTARSLRLKNIPECDGLSGGAAIERIATHGNPVSFPKVGIKLAGCLFSFAGIKSQFKRIIEEQGKDLGPVDVLPNVADICASFQLSVLNHFAKRVQRALLYCDIKGFLPATNRTLVMSGGVGSNAFIRKGLERLVGHYDCGLICPPPHLCTDNGIMIAWNGIEKLKKNIDVGCSIEDIRPIPKCPFGRDFTEDVEKTSIKLKRIKLL